jgi:hypothetical protein
MGLHCDLPGSPAHEASRTAPSAMHGPTTSGISPQTSGQDPRNTRIFHDRWGWWPMTGWFDAFRALGLISYDPAAHD